jgi:hypothetical protein
MRIKPLKPLNSISRILVVLIILSIFPLCAFASGNNSTDQTCNMGFGPFGYITEGNFTNVQTAILDSISKQITELQSLYTDVSKASNASDLQAVLSSHKLANECMKPDRMNIRYGKMHMGTIGMNGFNLINLAENVTDENLTSVQTEMLGSLQNATNMLKEQQNHTEVGQDNNRTQDLNENTEPQNFSTELQNLSTEVKNASTAAELKGVIFTYMQTQAIHSIDKEIEHLQAKISESKNTSDGNTSEEQLNSRITELNTLKENISGAKSLEDLKKITPLSHGISGIRENMMHQRGHGRHEWNMDRPGKVNGINNTTEDAVDNTIDNNTENNTENNTDISTN